MTRATVMMVMDVVVVVVVVVRYECRANRQTSS